jgi:hypothetical protein
MKQVHSYKAIEGAESHMYKGDIHVINKDGDHIDTLYVQIDMRKRVIHHKACMLYSMVN